MKRMSDFVFQNNPLYACAWAAVALLRHTHSTWEEVVVFEM